ncbi:MAG: undecaprenyldiphospho-muramoylpentapeptide beta-N-acetylglucosaminyltransferase [Stomatobaculum sp.]
MKKIILTGGGTAGHVTPNIALLPKLREAGFDILYIGSYEGIEKRLIEREGIAYRGISSGKLRRYFDLKNFTDPFRVLKGFGEAFRIIRDFHPDVVFSKGGYVSVPVVKAAQRHHIPVIIHESDITPGLANRLSYSSATKICCNFPETLQYLPRRKAVLTGSPIRAELLNGSRAHGLSLTGLPPEKPVLLVIGGSLGSRTVNDAIRAALPELLSEFSVLHLCGKGNIDVTLNSTAGYLQFEYVSEELKDYFALADLMVSRAGANSICEILALRRPNVLIPLSDRASRGDQVLNAHSFEAQGYSCVLREEALRSETLLSAVRDTWTNRRRYIDAMMKSSAGNGVDAVFRLIAEAAGNTEA